MKKVLVALLMLASVAHAEDWRNGDALFNATKRNHEQINIKWVPVANVQAACSAESKRRGFAGFNYAVDACSFWTGNVCIVYTEKMTTQHILGHEVRHCFAGVFHPE